jgi:cytochrome c oxidase subunit 3
LPESHARALAVQFDDLEQQHEAATLGMWIFLATEIMLFGGLFAAYAVYRNLFFPGFQAGSRLLNVTLGAVNTTVLLASSLTMALAVRSAQLGKRKSLTAFLLGTIVLGMFFIGVKLFLEWRSDYLDHLAPGLNFAYRGPHASSVELFFCFYFVMTGVHALHMIIGVGALSLLSVMAWLGKFSPERHNLVETVGLYWHFVDIIWIFLFPLLYLIGGRY